MSFPWTKTDRSFRRAQARYEQMLFAGPPEFEVPEFEKEMLPDWHACECCCRFLRHEPSGAEGDGDLVTYVFACSSCGHRNKIEVQVYEEDRW
jgi:hypothetical protein